MKHVVTSGIKADPELRKKALDIGRNLSDGLIHRKTDSGGYTLNWVTRHAIGEHYGDTWIERILRLEFHHQWVWGNHEYNDLIRELVEPFTNHYYKMLTRLQVIFYPPGVSNTVHRDRIIGQRYAEGLNITGGKAGYCDWPTWLRLRHSGDMKTDIDFHRKQHFTSGRLYLSDSSKLIFTDQTGFTDMDNTYLPLKGNHVYHPRDEFFFAYDDGWHSGAPSDDWRGILFFDGLFDPEKMKPIYDELIS